MGTYYSPEYKAQLNDVPPAMGKAFAAASPNAAKLRFKSVSYTLLGTELANELVYMTKLPAGAVLVPGLCRLATEDLGTDVDVQLGTPTTANAFIDTLDVGDAVHDTVFPASAGSTVLGTPLTAVTDVVLKILNGGAGFALTAGKKVRLDLVYVIQSDN